MVLSVPKLLPCLCVMLISCELYMGVMLNVMCIFVDTNIVSMFFESIKDLTRNQLLDLKVKQKGYAKTVTKLVKNREYTTGDGFNRITFRIVSILPSNNVHNVNLYRLNVEVSRMEISWDAHTWQDNTPRKGTKIKRRSTNVLRMLVERELGMFLSIFGMEPYFTGVQCVYYLEPLKIINRR